MKVASSALSILSVVSAALAGSNGHSISIVNNCPTLARVYKSGKNFKILAPKQSTLLSVPETWSGFIYTDANGGSSSGSGTTRAGFSFSTEGPDKYYIVRDESRFNVGMGIIPVEAGGSSTSCGSDFCNSPDCGSNAFTSPPTGLSGNQKPLFSCPRSKWDYTVELCPTSSFPPAIPRKAVVHHPAGRRDPGQQIHPYASSGKCVTVAGEIVNGSPVVIADCEYASADSTKQQFEFNHGDTQIKLSNYDFCLDAGTSDNVAVSIWACDGSESQTWTYTNNDQFQAKRNNAQCMDNTNGCLANGSRIQTASCQPYDTNQFWL